VCYNRAGNERGSEEQVRLDGKVALVTGAASGIGEGTVRAFAKAGAAVGVVDMRGDPAESVAQSIRDQGGRAIALVADVRQEDQVKKAVDVTASEFGRLDVVFANAGINGMKTAIEEMTLEEWNETMDTNLTGT